jgi:uncharacterized protein YbaR (Trm112 family)
VVIGGAQPQLGGQGAIARRRELWTSKRNLAPNCVPSQVWEDVAGTRPAAPRSRGVVDEVRRVKLDPMLLEILVCPDCKGTLTVDDTNDELVCDDCGLIYPVRDDIPIMLVSEARRAEQPVDEAEGVGDAGQSESAADVETAEPSDD